MLADLATQGRTRSEAATALEVALVRGLQTDGGARDQYLDMWRRSDVTAACGTYSGQGKLATIFEAAVRKIADGQAIATAIDEIEIVGSAADIERLHAAGKHGIVIDFQDTLPIADEIERVDLFYGLGLRMVQLTYNLQNLVGTGCTETYQSGLTYFGCELVQKLNATKILVDVSHCSEQVGWDMMDVSSAPVIVSH